MKTRTMILFLAAALMATAACTNDDNPVAVDNDTRVAARITAAMADGAVATPAGKAGQPATRAVNDRWNGDHIGVVVFKLAASDMATRYRNAHYVTTSIGTSAEFTPADAASTIYLADADETVEFCAYAPYQPSATSGTLPGTNGVITIDATRQATPEEQEAIDFIVAVGVTASKAHPTVAFTKVDDAHDYSFQHIMARLVLKIETPAAYGFDPADVERISRISIEGLCTGGTLDVKPDPAKGLGFGHGADWSTWTADWDISGCVHTVGPDEKGVMQRTHTLIIPFQYVKNMAGTPLKALPIAITLDGQVYRNDKDITGDADANGLFFSRKSYEYTIRLKKTGIEVTGATITDWADGGTGSGEAVQQ